MVSFPAVPPSDLNVLVHSVLFKLHTLIVPSELALDNKNLQNIYKFNCIFML